MVYDLGLYRLLKQSIQQARERKAIETAKALDPTTTKEGRQKL